MCSIFIFVVIVVMNIFVEINKIVRYDIQIHIRNFFIFVLEIIKLEVEAVPMWS